MSKISVDLTPAVEAAAPLFRQVLGGSGPLDGYEWDQLADIITAASPQINAQFARWLAEVGKPENAPRFIKLAEMMEVSTVSWRRAR